ncbi:hypothetical protein [Sphingomonas sp.]|jgi:hypothetical protein|uniref:hypothetical protein n=1 Tax=Sphingomonas sp. TaxID=28214 RepID=UPI0035C7EF1B
MPREQAANRRNVFAVLRRLFRWAISRGDIGKSPMEGMETPKAVKARERWLSATISSGQPGSLFRTFSGMFVSRSRSNMPVCAV